VVDLAGFPTFRVTDEDLLFRAHGFAHLPAFYSSSGQGRFDLPSPRGTLYLAFDRLTPFLESYRDSPDFDERQASEKSISRYKLRNAEVALADCTDTSAAEFGVPEWIHDCDETGYPKTQAWARSFDEWGYDGMLYWSRYARRVGVGLRSIALFGDAGERFDLPESMERFTAETVNQARRLGLQISYNPAAPVREIPVVPRA
jgi:RES domain